MKKAHVHKLRIRTYQLYDCYNTSLKKESQSPLHASCDTAQDSISFSNTLPTCFSCHPPYTNILTNFKRHCEASAAISFIFGLLPSERTCFQEATRRYS